MKQIIGSLMVSILLTSSCVASELILSSKLSLSYSEPKVVAHTGNMLIFKFSDWSFSHEVINPKSFNSAVDLTEIEHDFVNSLFYPALRKSFPPWLSSLSEETAASLAINAEQVSNTTVGNNIKVFSSYDKKEKQGYVFLLEEQQIHLLNIQGSANAFKQFVERIKERA
ncbi:hypothetical protein [Flocculibacter collagenilyticus]|uniref:hypothetical protein n=1 Tax=Flocculibacter collagenilyticus TaxID=2744479 RepID=UPI0018F3CC7F|nr:hypothetical protein [Flocculibacter collagenilyticus]